MNLQTAFGYSTFYETTTPLAGPPYVCVFEPDYEKDQTISQGTAKIMLDETKGAIDHWENLLKQRERNLENQKKWEITYKVVSLEEQKTFDIIQCSVLVRFSPFPHLKDLWYLALGVTEYLDYSQGDLRLLSVFYRQVGTCESHRDENFIYVKPCYTNSNILAVQVGNTVRHEFGHALGLGHYYSDDENLNIQWSKAKTSPPSIMVKYGVDIFDEQEIKQIDIDKVREIYGESGFLQKSDKQNTDNPFDSFFVSRTEFYQNDITEYLTVSGSISEKYFSFNQNMVITLRYPDGKTEQILSRPNEEGIFSVQLKVDEKSQLGTYRLKASYLEKQSQEISFMVLSSFFSPQKLAEDVNKIPKWIKNNAQWWSDGLIDDQNFLSGIQFLIDKGIMKITTKTQTEKPSLPFVPLWIKDTAGWWASGKVTDNDFVNGMKWLIENGIIRV